MFKDFSGDAQEPGAPVIGVSASLHDFGDYGGVGVQRPLFACGGVPLMLPHLPEAVEAALDRIDGVLLAPGRDIDPARYGQSPDPLLAPIEPRRDEIEFEIVPAALRRGLPILGICRGMQVINVALGGTMVQDVRLRERWREHPCDPGWSRWKLMESVALGELMEVPDHPRHSIGIAQPSLLGAALDTDEISVNSFHHQAVDALGEDLRATAVAPDGVVEALEIDARPVLGVQWELQEEWRVDARFLGVFRWFVGAAAQYAARVRAAA
jgi:putative glutamine amidotransferase